MSTELILPWGTKPKARPRVTKRGTYMPPDYSEWKEQVAEFINLKYPRTQLVRPLKMVVRFGSNETYVDLLEYDEPFVRAKYVRGDIDNLQGGVLDALQDSGIIMNDSQVVHVVASIGKRET